MRIPFVIRKPRAQQTSPERRNLRALHLLPVEKRAFTRAAEKISSDIGL